MNWIRQIFSRRVLDRDLADEIQQHLGEKVDELIENGMSREEALVAACRAFGNVALTEERGREVWRWNWLENFFSDVRYAARQLRRSPSFTLAAILTLAIGIGANTAVFSVVHSVLFRSLPFPDADQLVSVQSIDIRGSPHPTNLSYPTFFDFRNDNQVFEHIVSYRDDGFTLSGRRLPIRLTGQIVSADLFSLLRVSRH